MENTLNTLIKNCSTQKAVNNAQNVIFVVRFDYLIPILNTQKDFSSLFKAQKYLVCWAHFGSNWGLVVQQNMHEIVNYAFFFWQNMKNQVARLDAEPCKVQKDKPKRALDRARDEGIEHNHSWRDFWDPLGQ
jgi:hypothetical protein